jgi:predicted aspartyl protease
MTNDKESGWAKTRITQSPDDLRERGPITLVGISGQDTKRSNMFKVAALIDTGAHGTTISPRLAEKLALPVADRGEVREAGREVITADYFKVGLFFPRCGWIDLDVARLPSFDPECDVLIGRDILANCRLLVDFGTGITELHIKASSFSARAAT